MSKGGARREGRTKGDRDGERGKGSGELRDSLIEERRLAETAKLQGQRKRRRKGGSDRWTERGGRQGGKDEEMETGAEGE